MDLCGGRWWGALRAPVSKVTMDHDHICVSFGREDMKAFSAGGSAAWIGSSRARLLYLVLVR